MTITNATPLINVISGAYPLYLPQVRAHDTTKTFAEFPTEDILADLGYAVVYPSTRPVGQVVTEASPEVREGQWVQQWHVRDFTEAENLARFADLKQDHFSLIGQLNYEARVQGALYQFPDNTQYHIQLRQEDIDNLTNLRLRADSAKRTSSGAVFKFRTGENVMKVDLTADQVIVLTDVAFEKHNHLLEVFWSLKDQTESAQALAELPAIPQLTALGL